MQSPMQQPYVQDYALTLNRLLEHAAKWHPKAGVVTATDTGAVTRLTYEQLLTRSKAFSSGLRQLGVRFDRYSPDADASEQIGKELVPRDASVSTLAFAGALRYSFARLVVEVDHQSNARGRALNGAPTTLADDSLTFRAEASF